MPWLVLIVTTWLALFLQHGWLASAPLAPDLPLALVGWLLAAGGSRVLVRIWLVGVLADLAQPAGTCFHAVSVALVGLLVAPTRPGREVGAARLLLIPAVLDLGLGTVEVVLGARGPGLLCMVGGALATGLAGASIALVMGRLSKVWSPVPPLPEPGFGGVRTR